MEGLALPRYRLYRKARCLPINWTSTPCGNNEYVQSRDGRLTFSPSDLTGYLACGHLTQLERRVALGLLAKPVVVNPEAELVKRKGEEHEHAYLDRLRAQGRTVKEITLDPDSDWERAARETEDAIRACKDVVYQGVFVDPDGWRGIADPAS